MKKLWLFAPLALSLSLALFSTNAHAGAGQLTLTWTDNAPNEDGFKVERGAGPCVAGQAFTEIAGAVPPAAVAAPSQVQYVDTPLAAGSTWCYRVRAFNTAGSSAYTNTAAGTTLSAPGAPTNLQISLLDGLVDSEMVADNDGWIYAQGTVPS